MYIHTHILIRNPYTYIDNTYIYIYVCIHKYIFIYKMYIVCSVVYLLLLHLILLLVHNRNVVYIYLSSIHVFFCSFGGAEENLVGSTQAGELRVVYKKSCLFRIENKKLDKNMWVVFTSRRRRRKTRILHSREIASLCVCVHVLVNCRRRRHLFVLGLFPLQTNHIHCPLTPLFLCFFIVIQFNWRIMTLFCYYCYFLFFMSCCFFFLILFCYC